MVMHMARRSPTIRSLAYLAATAVCLAGILAIRRLEPTDGSLALHGVYDEVGHLLTALAAAIGVRALRLPVPWWSILAGALVLDLGHVPGIFGYLNALEGSSRNGSHSLSVVALLACLGFLDRRHAHIWLGVAIGATSHLWRDMGTGTVALLWPIRDTVYGTLFSRYIAVLGGMALAMIGAAALLGIHTKASHDRIERHPRLDAPGTAKHS